MQAFHCLTFRACYSFGKLRWYDRLVTLCKHMSRPPCFLPIYVHDLDILHLLLNLLLSIYISPLSFYLSPLANYARKLSNSSKLDCPTFRACFQVFYFHKILFFLQTAGTSCQSPKQAWALTTHARSLQNEMEYFYKNKPKIIIKTNGDQYYDNV